MNDNNNIQEDNDNDEETINEKKDNYILLDYFVNLKKGYHNNKENNQTKWNK